MTKVTLKRMENGLIAMFSRQFSCAKPISMMALAFATLSTIIFLSNGSQAQTSQCLQLQNQLSSLNGGGIRNVSPRYRQYDRAAKQQRAQIQKTKRMARINGCRGSFFNRRNSGTCGRILNSLDQMNTNLAALEQQRRKLAPRNAGGSDAQRRRIIRAMNQRGCFNTAGQRLARAEPRRRTLAEQIFGVRTFRNDGFGSGYLEQPGVAMYSRNGTYRTLCVRKSDGYYFPISFSTAPARFEYDEGICQARCAGTEVALYYHAMPAQDSEDMVSFREQLPYRDLPNAFAYRKSYDSKNSCRFSSGIFHEVAGAAGGSQIKVEEQGSLHARVGQPIFRPDRAIDPESASNDFGKLALSDIVSILNPKPTLMVEDGNQETGRKIRVVGPAFYPVQ